mgnify:CR=1 FL=1|jgi:hypothetical protein
MAGNFVPPTQSSTLGTSGNRWAGGFFDELAVKTLKVIGGGTENNAQPATIGWVKQAFSSLLKSALDAAGLRTVSSGKTGYICFGSLFGGLIIQWGEPAWEVGQMYTDVSYPVEFKKTHFVIPLDVTYFNGAGTPKITPLTVVQQDTTMTKFRALTTDTNIGSFTYLAVGF